MITYIDLMIFIVVAIDVLFNVETALLAGSLIFAING